MTQVKDDIKGVKVSFAKVYRLIFVVFFLYLLRDAIWRWDGFRFYAPFSDFLATVALVTIPWSIVAIFSAFIIWLLLRGIEWFCLRRDWKIKIDILFMFIIIFVFITVMVWIGKRIITTQPLPFILKSTIVLSITIIAIYLTWIFREKTDIFLQGITPLVWIFSIWAIVSIPIVAYHTWWKQTDTDKVISQKISQPSKIDRNRPNIILVIFDAMTARDMSVYGYHRETTPFIKKWVKTASLFTNVKAESNFTPPTVASIMTGKRVWTHRVFQEKSKLTKSDIESLPLVLKKNGYFNMAFVQNSVASPKALGFDNSFDISPRSIDLVRSPYLIGWQFAKINIFIKKLFEGKIREPGWIISPRFIFGQLIRTVYYYFVDINQTEVSPKIVFDKFFETINKNNIPEPFFAWIHLFPPHDPYLPPEPYIGMFDSSNKLRTYNQQEPELKYIMIKNDEHWSIFRARYDEFIRYCDKEFEDFITRLSRNDKLKDAIIIFTSDHGESFEHNYFNHTGPHLYEQVTHVPLIIKEPGQTRGMVIHDLVDQIDLAPTILNLANIPIPSWMEGRSLVPLLRGKKLPPRPVFSMNFQKNMSTRKITKGTIAIWEGDYKLIHYLENKKSLLFNLKKDPSELENLFEKKKEIGSHLLNLIYKNLKLVNERIGDGK
jgi:arylsulfatase A-like enzyme